MNELAVQAANGTNSESDRQSIQDEISQLTTEIDRVAETTKFNETYLLKGGQGKTTKTLEGHDAGITGTFVDGAKTATLTVNLKVGNSITIGGVAYNIVDDDKTVDDLNSIQSAVMGAGTSVTINGTTYTAATDANNNAITNDAGDALWTAGTGTNVTLAEIAAKVEDGSKVKVDTNAEVIARDRSLSTNITAGTAKTLIKQAVAQANSIGADTAMTSDDVKEASALNTTTGKWAVKFDKKTASVIKDLSFDLHVGADADMTNKITVNVSSMTAKGLGISGLNVADDSGMAATYAIDAIADAISTVSAQRSALGAVQNRLEHTINNLDNVVENTTSAESRIRDTDMAEEMVNYSKNNILSQAGQSMLAQANQSNQGVLSLLG
jgi:flagellin